MASVLITRGLESADGLFFPPNDPWLPRTLLRRVFWTDGPGEVNDLELVVEFRLIVFFSARASC